MEAVQGEPNKILFVTSGCLGEYDVLDTLISIYKKGNIFFFTYPHHKGNLVELKSIKQTDLICLKTKDLKDFIKVI